MQISLSKFSLFLAGIVSLGLVGATGYLFFTIFFKGPEPEIIPVPSLVNLGIFGPRIRSAAGSFLDPKSKISLDNNKDLKFLTSQLFVSFTEKPDYVDLSKVRGREDPFVPYVTP